jgi:hypothetical protein
MYEVNDLYEVGQAGATIQAKETLEVDEISGFLGPDSAVYEEE